MAVKVNGALASPPFLILGCEGTTPQCAGIRETLDLLRTNQIQGVLLFAANIVDSLQLTTLTQCFREAQPEVIISVDQEGGAVQRLTAVKGFHGFPSAAEVAALPDDQVLAIYRSMAHELADHGITLNFGPCVDLDPTHVALSPIIGALGRSYGDAARTMRCAELFVQAHAEAGVATCLKHFPGHGSAQGDTHQGLTCTTGVWQPSEMSLYRDILATQWGQTVPYVMTAHISHDDWGSIPATFSAELLTTTLHDAYGFKGCIIADDFHMQAILEACSPQDALRQAYTAGVRGFIFSFSPYATGGQDVGNRLELVRIFWSEMKALV